MTNLKVKIPILSIHIFSKNKKQMISDGWQMLHISFNTVHKSVSFYTYRTPIKDTIGYFWHLSLSLSLSLSLTYSGRTGVFAGDMEEHTVLSGDDVGHAISIVGDWSEPTPSWYVLRVSGQVQLVGLLVRGLQETRIKSCNVFLQNQNIYLFYKWNQCFLGYE